MSRTFIAAAALTLIAFGSPAFADDDTIVVTATTPAPSSVKVREALSRPAALTGLYASYAALQAYDVYSTRQALSRGGREANPLMQDVVGNTGMFIALKAAVAAGTIVAAERLWKSDKKVTAIAVLVASNGVAAIVAARNARTLRQLR